MAITTQAWRRDVDGQHLHFITQADDVSDAIILQFCKDDTAQAEKAVTSQSYVIMTATGPNAGTYRVVEVTRGYTSVFK